MEPLSCEIYDSFGSLARLTYEPENFSTLTEGTDSPSCALNPKIWPTNPDGFGIGHSLAECFFVSSTIPISSFDFSLLRLLFPSSVVLGSSPSAYMRVLCGTGHGMTCGSATTTNERTSVEVNSERVVLERGWSAGGIVVNYGHDR